MTWIGGIVDRYRVCTEIDEDGRPRFVVRDDAGHTVGWNRREEAAEALAAYLNSKV